VRSRPSAAGTGRPGRRARKDCVTPEGWRPRAAEVAPAFSGVSDRPNAALEASVGHRNGESASPSSRQRCFSILAAGVDSELFGSATYRTELPPTIPKSSIEVVSDGGGRPPRARGALGSSRKKELSFTKPRRPRNAASAYLHLPPSSGRAWISFTGRLRSSIFAG
jgi:hypothetical protein